MGTLTLDFALEYDIPADMNKSASITTVPEPRFAAPTARKTDPETSAQAAELATLSASAGRLKAARALRHDNMTDFEVAKYTGVQQTSIGKRRLELQRAGLVEPQMGMKRLAPSGAWAQVWRLTNAGREWLAAQEDTGKTVARWVVVKEEGR